MLDVETRFMQNYRVAAPVSGGTQIAAIRNGAGDVELFSLASDGTIWNFYPDPSSASGYTGVSTGLSGSTFAVGRDSDGRLILFVASLLTLTAVKETTGSARWGTPVSLSYPAPPAATRVAHIEVDDIGGQLYVALLVQYPSVTGPLYAFFYSVWSDTSPTFQRSAAMNLSSTNCAWLGSTPETAAFAGIQGLISTFTVASEQIQQYSMAAFHSLSVSATLDGEGNSQVFAVLADGNVYQLVGGQGGAPYGWSQISREMTLRQVGSATDSTGAAHVFAVSGDNQLYHWQPDPSTQTGYDNGTALATAVAQAALAADDTASVDLFAVGTAQSTLSHLFREEQSTNWTTQTVEVPQGGAVEEYVSYTSDVAVHDARGVLLANVPVTISASEEARVSVNGSVYFVTPDRPIRTSTNAAGLLSLAQQTGTLAIPALGLNVTGYSPSGQTIAIEQSSDVQAKLATTTGPDLMAATDASGAYLLPEQYRTPTTTTSLANAVNQCMKLPGRPVSHVEPMQGIRRSNRGVGTIRQGSIGHLGKLSAPAADQHWRLVFGPSGVRYEELSATHAAALIAARRASYPSANGFFDWLDDVGDFFAGVVDETIEIIETVITTVAEGVQAAITAVIDGVTYLYETVVDAVEQVFDFVEMVFAAVKVAFEQLFEWLGFLFSWPDILRTHEALAYATNEFLSFLGGAAGGIQRIVDQGIQNLQSQIATLFDEAVNQIAGQQSLGGYQQAQTPSDPAFIAGTANNIVFNGTIENANAAAPGSQRQGGEDDDPITALIAQLQQFAGTVEATSAFGDAEQYFTTLGGSPDEMFSQLLATLLRLAEAVIEAILSGVQALVDALLGLMGSVVAGLQALLNETWDIPFVSDLYEWVTGGSDLTTLDLVALIAAIPTTIVYKAVYDEAPFPTDDSVAAFKASFDATRMLQAAGLGPEDELDALATGDGVVLPVAMQRLTAVGAGVSLFGFGWVTAVLDGIPKGSPPILSQVALGLELGAQAGTFPWFYSNGAPDCTTGPGTARTLWIVMCVGVGIDTVFVVGPPGRIPENWDDLGVGIEFVYGLGHLATAIVASIGQGGATVANNILPVIPELGKVLRLQAVVAATKSVSLFVIAAIDAACYTAAGIITAVSVPSDQVLSVPAKEVSR